MFFLYSHDAYQHLLTKISLLHAAHEKDKADLEERQLSASRRKRLSLKLKHDHFRAECQKQLLDMSRDTDNSPIMLQGDRCLDYDCIAAYMNTKSKTETVSRDLAQQVETCDAQLNSTADNSAGSRVPNDSDTVKVKVQQSKSAYTSIQSSIAYLYRQNNIERSTEMKSRISTYIAGCTRRCKYLLICN